MCLVKKIKVYKATTKRLEGLMNCKTSVEGDFSTLFLLLDKSNKETRNKEMKAFIEGLEFLGLIYLCITLHIHRNEYTCFSNAYGTFSRMDHMLNNLKCIKL